MDNTPVAMSVLVDLSSQHFAKTRNTIEEVFRSLNIDDIYYNFSTKEFTYQKASIVNQLLNPLIIKETIGALASCEDYRKCLVYITDICKDCDFFYLDNIDDFVFYFLKVGKHNPNFERAVSKKHSFYFNNVKELTKRIEEFICKPVMLSL